MDNMPLCTLEIPTAVWSGLSAARKREVGELGGRVLDTTREKLQVPDPEDREIRIVTASGPHSQISVSFTSGPNEYPDFPGREAFFPSPEQMRAVGMAAQSLGRYSVISVERTLVELWKDTTFLLVERNNYAVPQKPEELDNVAGLTKFIYQPRLALVVSPAMIEQAGAQNLETEGSLERNPYAGQGMEVASIIAETLKLPKRNIAVSVVTAAEADTDFSVEFDCQPQKGNKLPPEIRGYLAGLVEQYLNSNPSTRKGSAEVWIRQGIPQTEIITSS
ncbi:hypothetical protein A2701_00020 [Candidatus Amesbacteria bacterium RIFCSPHIGHO2_01_FULL_47_34]|nr:MAG: hypothetical protein A2701_00020 [Candidatus Amesbacteria bacterium RIFCSPHIGHO2_01_FULL_47_34]